jgi:hypothetical protein
MPNDQLNNKHTPNTFLCSSENMKKIKKKKFKKKRKRKYEKYSANNYVPPGKIEK